jgi:hypothetical protein
MIRLMSSPFSAAPMALALAASCWATASFAQSAPATTEPVAAEAQPAPPSTGDTRRLTDEQRNEILNNNTVEKAAAARGELSDSDGPGRGIHGEVGFMIGTNGTRGAYGTADIPLGDNAQATVSVESSTFGYRRR